MQANRPRIYAIAKENYGLEMNPGPFGFDSRPSLIGAKFAEEQGVGPAYHDAIMRAYWQEAKALDDLDTLVEIAESIGLDGAAYRAAIDDETYRQAVIGDIEQAHDYGIHGVPGMIFGNKYLISGAQPYEVLVQAIEKIQEEENRHQALME